MKKIKLLTGLLASTSLASVGLTLASCSIERYRPVEIKIFAPEVKGKIADNDLQDDSVPYSYIILDLKYQGAVVLSSLDTTAKFNAEAYKDYKLQTQVTGMTEDTIHLMVYSTDVDFYSDKQYDFSLKVVYDGTTFVDGSDYWIKYKQEFLIPESSKKMSVVKGSTFNYIRPEPFYLCHEPEDAWQAPYVSIDTNTEKTDQIVLPDKSIYYMEMIGKGKYQINNMVLLNSRSTLPAVGTYKLGLIFNYGSSKTETQEIDVQVGPKFYSLAMDTNTSGVPTNPIQAQPVASYKEFTFDLTYIEATPTGPNQLQFLNPLDADADFSNFYFFGYSDDAQEQGYVFHVESVIDEADKTTIHVTVTFPEPPVHEDTTSFTLYPMYNGKYYPYSGASQIYFRIP